VFVKHGEVVPVPVRDLVVAGGQGEDRTDAARLGDDAGLLAEGESGFIAKGQLTASKASRNSSRRTVSEYVSESGSTRGGSLAAVAGRRRIHRPLTIRWVMTRSRSCQE
jgi:hypothetical protein